MPERFDYDLLNSQDPFEVDDDNLPHLFKHAGLGLADVYDVWASDPLFYEPERGAADWLMVGEVPGAVLCVPLAASRTGDVSKCRPIGVYEAGTELRGRYLADQG